MRALIIAFITTALFASFQTPVFAADLPAGTTAELINAIDTANNTAGADTIILSQGGTYTLDAAALDPHPAFGKSGLPQIKSEITIEGNGATIERSSTADMFRIFTVVENSNLTLKNLIIKDGYADDTTFYGKVGGGLVNFRGTVSLTNVTVSDNTASFGGGIYNFEGSVTILNSTLNNNTATSSGAGTENASNSINFVATLSIKNSTINANNCVADFCNGGGISNKVGSNVEIINSTIAGNAATSGGGIQTEDLVSVKNSILAANSGGNCAGTITSNDNNIDDDATCGFAAAGIDPLLDPNGLFDNGGPTKTIALQSTSPAINAADPSVCTGALATDQRGVARLGTCDIGAYEFSCGNSTVETGEGCDDGNQSSGDGCDSTCGKETSQCGDGQIQGWAGEECDDGNQTNADGCDSTCRKETSQCGDGQIQGWAGEECDDGNQINTDACLSTCKNARCGDGVVRTGQEGCDDGNQNNSDGCSSTCQEEIPPTTTECDPVVDANCASPTTTPESGGGGGCALIIR